GDVLRLLPVAFADRSRFVHLAAARILRELDELGVVEASDRAAFGELVDGLLHDRFLELGRLDRSSDDELTRAERAALLEVAGGLGARDEVRRAGADGLDRWIHGED